MYQQRVGVAMGYPLGLFLARIILVELENSVATNMKNHLCFLNCYVDDTLAIVKEGSIDVLQHLNSFHPYIQFTFEMEPIERIPFLDILIIWKKSRIETTVYRKSTNTVIYLYWFSFATNIRK